MSLRKFVLAATLVTLAPAIFAQVPEPRKEDVLFIRHATPGMAAAMNPLDDESLQAVKSTLALSDVQVAALKALVAMRDETTQRILQSMQENQEKLEDLLAHGSATPVEVGNAFLAVRNTEDSLKAARDKFRTDFTAMLNPDQRAVLDRLQSALQQAGRLAPLQVLDDGPISVMGFRVAPAGRTTAIGFERGWSKDN